MDTFRGTCGRPPGRVEGWRRAVVAGRTRSWLPVMARMRATRPAGPQGVPAAGPSGRHTRRVRQPGNRSPWRWSSTLRTGVIRTGDIAQKSYPTSLQGPHAASCYRRCATPFQAGPKRSRAGSARRSTALTSMPCSRIAPAFHASRRRPPGEVTQVLSAHLQRLPPNFDTLRVAQRQEIHPAHGRLRLACQAGRSVAMICRRVGPPWRRTGRLLTREGAGSTERAGGGPSQGHRA